MKTFSQIVRRAYDWVWPTGMLGVPGGVLLYVPNVIRVAAALFCVVGTVTSIPYIAEHWGDTRLVLLRIAAIIVACLASIFACYLLPTYYKAVVTICCALGITVTILTPAYADGPFFNPHGLLVISYVVGAGFCLGRRGVLLSTGWIIFNYTLLSLTTSWPIWSQPVTLSPEHVMRENISTLFFLLLMLVPTLLGYLAPTT